MASDPSHRPKPRQDPVSCESCRKKKLKCSRECPCSNCVSRGVSCEFQGRKAPAPASAPTSTANPDEIVALKRENAAIKARLSNLEEVVYSRDSPSETDPRPRKAQRLANDNQVANLSSPSSTMVSNSPHPEVTKNYSRDVHWLEGLGTQENSRLPRLSSDFSVRIASLNQIIFKATTGDHTERCVWLPEEALALHFFDLYVEQLDPVQHLIHVPTARRSLEELYKKLELGLVVESQETVLLVAILASVATYWGITEDHNSTFDTKQSATNVAVFWIRTCLDILEHLRRSAPAYLETVQASILTAFLVYHIEGFSPKVRALALSTISIAKDLGLHRTDDPNLHSPETSQPEIIDRELRRRVWWHLASTDWGLAFAGGPHEHTYNIHPNQMLVNRPRNLTDDDLATQPATFSRPLSEPTIMAYHLQRIRLNEICRSMADLGWETTTTTSSIREIDARFTELLSNLPVFMRLDPHHRERYRDLDKTHPEVLMQRYTINLTTNARRCKFHIPYLLLAAHDPAFAFSRQACLQAARTVMEAWAYLLQEDGGLWIASARLGGMLYHFFYATMVLVMDYCVNRDEQGEKEDGERKEEIRAACRTLEEARHECGAAGMFLESLTAVMRKHRVRLLNAEQGPDGSSNTKTIESNVDWNHAGDDLIIDPSTTLDFDELWQSFIEFESSTDPLNWSALLNDVDTMYKGG